jgi:hypothetical protein
MILVAASQLEDQGQSPFSAEDLIVQAWREFPGSFGLKGYANQHPDANRVLSSIMGERGLARRGWLCKMGQKMYSLSPDGRKFVRKLTQGDVEEVDECEVEDAKPRLPSDQEKHLLALLDSVAVEKHTTGQDYELTFADAHRFWDIGENTKGELVDKTLQHTVDILAAARELCKSSGLVIDQREISVEEIDMLSDVSNYLKDRFSRHLNLLRRRAT